MGNRWLEILSSVRLFLLAVILTLLSCRKKEGNVPKVSENNNRKTGLVQVNNFGSNPGNLTMYRYVPKTYKKPAPLVVVLHGCTQNVREVLHNSEWELLAERYGFLLLLPETKATNNAQKCFNWFENAHQRRDAGEPLSIKQMVDNMKLNFTIDQSKIFITGLSAGGAMTANLLATYPDVFKAGAIVAAGPYKSATNFVEAGSAMYGNITKTSKQWGDLVRGAYNYSGAYPTLTIIHGVQDPTVNINNANELIKQWTNVHKTDPIPDQTSSPFYGATDVTEYKYNDSASKTVIVYYKINNLGHALPVFPGSGNAQGGKTGTYSVNKGFYGPYWIGKFFGIIP